MIFVKKTICITKVGIGTTKLYGLVVHHIHESIHGTCHVFPCRIGGFIGGTHQNTVKTFFQRDGLSHIHTDVGTVSWDTENRFVGKSYHVIQITVLHGKKTGKHFGGAGRIKAFMDVFGIQDHSRINIHQNSSLSTDLGPRRPGGNSIRLYGKFFSFLP